MAALRRVQAGAYDLSQCTPLADIVACQEPERLLRPVDEMFAQHPALRLTAAQEKCVRNGAAFTCNVKGTYRVYGQDGSFLAVCQEKEGKLTTIKNFF